MDFSKFDSRSAAEIPQEVHLRDPASGDEIFDGTEPCIVLVVGSHSRTVQAGILEDARKKVSTSKGKKKKDEDSQALADVQKTLTEGAARVIRGFVNMEHEDGHELDADAPDDVQWFLDLNFISIKSLLNQDEEDEKWLGDSFAQQILKASNDSGNYLGKQ